MKLKNLSYVLMASFLSSQIFAATTAAPKASTDEMKSHAGSAKTAETQMKGSASDVEVTRRIRERLTDSEKLSTSAKNINIVTLGETVTLSGNVKSQQEMSMVNSIAKEVAVGKNIKNEVRVTK